MITPEIVAYIRAEKAKGTDESVIKSNLLDNGWKQEDIIEALSSVAANPSSVAIPQPEDPIVTAALRKHRNQRTLITFGVLAIVDIVLILALGSSDPFGLNIYTILLRIVIIYGIASFSSIGSKQKKTALHTTLDAFARIVAALFLAFIVMIGIFFVLCLFAIQGSGGF